MLGEPRSNARPDPGSYCVEDAATAATDSYNRQRRVGSHRSHAKSDSRPDPRDGSTYPGTITFTHRSTNFVTDFAPDRCAWTHTLPLPGLLVSHKHSCEFQGLYLLLWVQTWRSKMHCALHIKPHATAARDFTSSCFANKLTSSCFTNKHPSSDSTVHMGPDNTCAAPCPDADPHI